MADAPRLNSLDRYRKDPGRLVLEEHGHCEVPAGCGGVVLRWRNPLAMVPILLRLYTPTTAALLIDGRPVEVARVDLSPGPHVLGVRADDVDRARFLLLFTAEHDPSAYRTTRPAGLVEPKWQVNSADDGSWTATLTAPQPEWMQPGHRGAGWVPLTQTSTKTADRSNRYLMEACVRAGAVALGLPRGARVGRGPVWVRKAFEVPRPAEGPK